MTTQAIQLTEEQQVAVDRISDWLKKPEPLQFSLGGYAGTGKTTVIKALLAHLADDYSIEVAAFTGKAVNVLQRKGIRKARTLHSLIYYCRPLPKGGFIFELRTTLENKLDLIIVDEASMISSELYRDLKSFGVKLLFVGDPGQLEPVGDNPNLMRNANLVLQKIHRQAEGSPIITLANSVRLGGSVTPAQSKEGCRILSKLDITIPIAATFDQVICARNKTRTTINQRFRHLQSKPTNELRQGDKIIVLRNHPGYMVFNGMILFVELIVSDLPLCTIINAKDEVDNRYLNLPIWKEPFQKDIGKEFKIPLHKEKQMVYADFGYCITCHKSQGSEWDSVLVWDEWMPPQVWDMKRWRYTAITRAANNLTIAL